MNFYVNLCKCKNSLYETFNIGAITFEIAQVKISIANHDKIKITKYKRFTIFKYISAKYIYIYSTLKIEIKYSVNDEFIRDSTSKISIENHDKIDHK